MHIYDATGQRVELDLVAEEVVPEVTFARTRDSLEASPVVRASRAFFELGRTAGHAPAMPSRAARAPSPPIARFVERESGLVRTVYKEIVIRFRPALPARVRRAVLTAHRLEARRGNAFVNDQIVARSRDRSRIGPELLDIANALAEREEVVFATPNFVSEFRRTATTVRPEQWHLDNRGTRPGQANGEDVDAVAAWALSTGKRRVVAVLDDGVDVDHPDLKRRIWKNPDANAPDRTGRDFFVPNDHPDHFNPRPKRFAFPFDQMRGNDIHGTPCAGVVASSGKGAHGVAFGARILPVKVFHADDLAADERVADAIRYAALHADVLSCSWSGPLSPDLQLALADAGTIGRNGRGAAVFCANGNEATARVSYPARDPNAIAVGASTDKARLAQYSNTGPETSIVAPSSGGVVGIFTTDVSYAGRGFNIGTEAAGGGDGLYTNSFGGTSSATPLAAGVAALVLSVAGKLNRNELKSLLEQTADRIDRGYDSSGHSDRYGFGRVNASRAVEAAKEA